MYGFSLAALAMAVYLAVISFVTAQQVNIIALEQVQIGASHLSIYGSVVSQYAHGNATFTGSVSDATAALPAWFKRAASEGNYVATGTTYVYTTPTDYATGMAMARFLKVPRAGIKVNGVLVVPGGQASGITIPAAVPNGAVVLML